MNTPTINANLNPCNTAHTCRDGHHINCPGKPVLVPLPLEPWRSVTFTVRLGECDCPSFVRTDAAKRGREFKHRDYCPAHPVKVTCAIGGDGTWAGSEVTDVALWGPNGLFVPFESEEQFQAVLAACRDRWALVKALVTGDHPDHDTGRWTGPTLPLFTRRDAVFSAICEMVRADDAHAEAYARAWSAMNKDGPSPEKRAAPWVLAHYVDRLIEQVCVLGAES